MELEKSSGFSHSLCKNGYAYVALQYLFVLASENAVRGKYESKRRDLKEEIKTSIASDQTRIFSCLGASVVSVFYAEF